MVNIKSIPGWCWPIVLSYSLPEIWSVLWSSALSIVSKILVIILSTCSHQPCIQIMIYEKMRVWKSSPGKLWKIMQCLNRKQYKYRNTYLQMRMLTKTKNILDNNNFILLQVLDNHVQILCKSWLHPSRSKWDTLYSHRTMKKILLSVETRVLSVECGKGFIRNKIFKN